MLENNPSATQGAMAPRIKLTPYARAGVSLPLIGVRWWDDTVVWFPGGCMDVESFFRMYPSGAVIILG